MKKQILFMALLSSTSLSLMSVNIRYQAFCHEYERIRSLMGKRVRLFDGLVVGFLTGLYVKDTEKVGVTIAKDSVYSEPDSLDYDFYYVSPEKVKLFKGAAR